jgi:glutamate synthase (ferredoxin)
MRAREALFESPHFSDIQRIMPIIDEKGSDTACFDNALELLVMAGRPIHHAMMMMIPEPWDGHESMSQEKKDFYEYHSCLMEPWDGPASIAFTDGQTIGAVLDRNGLRPSRYYVPRTIGDYGVGGRVLPIEPERFAQGPPAARRCSS